MGSLGNSEQIREHLFRGVVRAGHNDFYAHCNNSYFDCKQHKLISAQEIMNPKKEEDVQAQLQLEKQDQLKPVLPDFRQLFSGTHDLGLLLELLREEVYMNYKDYQSVRSFFLAHKLQFDGLAQFLRKLNKEMVLSGSIFASNQKCNNDEATNIRYQQILHFILIAAKACFIKHQYSACIHILVSNLPLDIEPHAMPFKILYERQNLLIKAHYLNRHEARSHKAAEECLRKIFAVGKDYEDTKTLCGDWLAIQSNARIYDKNISRLYQAIKKSLKTEIMLGRELVGIITEFMQSLNQKVTIFSGLPIFIISTQWMAQAKAYLQNPAQAPSPGCPLNLDLLNSVFEFEPHPQSSKFYMDTLMFPATLQVDYQVLSPNQWKPIFSKLGGVQIKRFSVRDKLFVNNLTADTLVKMVLECDGHLFVLQWQDQSLWEQSVLPYIRQNMLGPGQMKERFKKINQNKEIYQESLPVRGAIQQTKNRYRYCNIPEQLRKAFSTRILQRLLSKYDMESHSAANKNQSAGIMGLSITDKDLLHRSKKQGANSRLYLLACLHCLGGLAELMGLCCTTETFLAIAEGQSENEAEYLAAFWDFMKRMWFSHPNQNILDCTSFCSIVINRLQKSDVSKDSSIFAFNRENALLSFMERIIEPIFMFAPSFSLHQKPPTFYSSLEHMRTVGLDSLRKYFPQESFSVFAQYHYSHFHCPHCCEDIGYELVPKLSMAVDVPQFEQYLKFYLVIPNFKGRRKLSMSYNSRLDEKQSAKQFLQTEPTVVANNDSSRGKSVQQVIIKLKTHSKVSEAMAILCEELDMHSGQAVVTSGRQKKWQFVMALINEETNTFCEIYNSNRKAGIPDIGVDEVNAKVSQVNKNKNRLYVFVVAVQDEDKELAIISFKDPVSNQCKAFPQLIQLRETPSASNFIFAAERSKRMIKESLVNATVEIAKIEVIQNETSKDQRSRITCFINLYTQSKIVSERTTQRFQLSDKHSQNQKAASEKKTFYLEQCIQAMFGQNKTEDKPEEAQDSRAPKQSQRKQKMQCHKCKRSVNPTFELRLLEFSKVIIICLNRRPQQGGARIDTNIRVPNNLNMRNFVIDQSSRRKNYALRSIIICTSNENESNMSSRERFSAVVRSTKNGRWYHEQAEQTREIDFDSIDGKSVELLVYERDQQPRSETGLHVA